MSVTVQTHPIAELKGAAGPRVREFVVRWEISPGAILASPAAAARLNGHALGLSSASVDWRVRIHGDEATAECDLIVETQQGGHDAIPLVPPTPARVLTDDSNAQPLHMDAPGLLSLSIRLDPPRILYARSSIISETLALPGGVYDAPTLG